MRIGVISDIHSNYVAFKECVKYLENLNCDEYFLLGDYISDTSYTRETMEYLYSFINSHECHILRGNREEYMLSQRRIRKEGREEEFWIPNSCSGNLLYTYERLSNEDFDFFESLPKTFIYEKEGLPSITCAHGSPDNTRELLQLYGDNTREWLMKIDTEYMLCAHTHFPGEIEYRNRHYFNTGCVGIAINDYGFAQCMTLDLIEKSGVKCWYPTFLKIPYDKDMVVEDLFKSGLSDMAPWFINSNVQILLTGTDNSAALVEKAVELSSLAKENKKWPHIDEQYFEMAAELLGIPDYRKTGINRL